MHLSSSTPPVGVATDTASAAHEVGDDVDGGLEEGGGGSDAADKALLCPICLVRAPWFCVVSCQARRSA